MCGESVVHGVVMDWIVKREKDSNYGGDVRCPADVRWDEAGAFHFFFAAHRCVRADLVLPVAIFKIIIITGYGRVGRFTAFYR